MVRFIQTECSGVGARGGDFVFQFGKTETGVGYKPMWVCSMPLTCVVTMVNFVLCTVYYREKIKGGGTLK